MSKKKLAFHAHDYVVTTDSYENSDTLKSFFNVLATDNLNGTEFVVAVEAKHYPIMGTMFHPETQQLRVFG